MEINNDFILDTANKLCEDIDSLCNHCPLSGVSSSFCVRYRLSLNKTMPINISINEKELEIIQQYIDNPDEFIFKTKKRALDSNIHEYIWNFKNFEVPKIKIKPQLLERNLTKQNE